MRDCHLVLHGHLHETELTWQETPDARVMVIAAGASYETRTSYNRYNLVRLDPEDRRGTVFLRAWSDRGDGFWTSDILTYRNVPDGEYRFSLRGEPASSKPASPQPIMPSNEQACQRYLRWMARTYGRLVLGGIQSGQRPYIELNLDDVYVPLEALEILPAQERHAAHMAKGKEGMSVGRRLAAPDVEESESQALEQPGTRPINLKDLLSVGPRIVVIGGPGSGKSTVLRYVAWTLAQALVEGRPELARDRLGLDGPLPMPILVPLHAFAEHRARCRAAADPELSTLAACLHDYLTREKGALDLSTGFFKSLLNAGNCLVMLDGLDEVGSEGERELVCRAVENLADWLPANRFIVTSRPAAYTGQAVIAADFRQVQVQPLEHDDVVQLVTRLYRAADHAEETEQLLSWLDELEAYYRRRRGDEERQLIDSPLMVRMVAIVDLSGEKLPEQRAELYDRFVDTLLRVTHHTEAAIRQALEKLGGPAEDQRQWLAVLAHAMHSGETGIRSLPESQVRALLCRHLAPTRGEAEAAEVVRKFLAATRSRAGLVEVRGGPPDRWSFTHHPFQEFLAAVYLADIVDEVSAIAAELEVDGRVAQAWWREVILLLLGYLSFRNPDKANRLARRLARLPDPAAKDWPALSDAARQVGAPLAAAERVAVALLERPGALPRLEREVAERLAALFRDADLMNVAPPRLRAAAGEALAQLGDPRFRADAWYLPDEPLLGFVEVPGDPFLMGTPADDIPALLKRFGGERDWYEDETPQSPVDLPAYYIARYPVTHAQYWAFVQDTGHKAPTAEADYEQPYAWRDGQPPPQRLNQPVVLVTWRDARAYCTWLTGRLRAWEGTPPPLAARLREDGWAARLPTEAEWEKAARGTDGRAFPWGEEPDPNRANFADTGIGTTSAVGCFPGGISPYGALDMSGNVWEWCQSLYKDYPYDRNDGREKLDDNGGRVLRGGAFYYLVGNVRCASRNWIDPDLWLDNVGFRVVVAPG
jgi:formylglycine-generating enzyme required for sulfatase activity